MAISSNKLFVQNTREYNVVHYIPCIFQMRPRICPSAYIAFVIEILELIYSIYFVVESLSFMHKHIPTDKLKRKCTSTICDLYCYLNIPFWCARNCMLIKIKFSLSMFKVTCISYYIAYIENVFNMLSTMFNIVVRCETGQARYILVEKRLFYNSLISF